MIQSKPLYLFTMLLPALLVGCSTISIAPTSPAGDFGAFIAATVPLGATATTATTATPGPAVQANEIQKQIDNLMQSLEHPEVKNNRLLYDSTLQDIADKMRMRDALLSEALTDPVDEPGPVLFDEETPAGRPADPRPAGFWRGLGNGILAGGQFVKDGFFDYSSKTEGAKSATGSALIVYGLTWLGNNRQWWQVNEVQGAVHNSNSAESKALADSAKALANRNATTVSTAGSGNNFTFTDLPQDTQLKVEFRGNNNNADFDFQRDTQREGSVTFIPANGEGSR